MTAATRYLGHGSSTAKPADSESARTRRWSPRIRAGSCRTRWWIDRKQRFVHRNCPMTEKYGFEQLDRETRDYLLHARDEAGHGMPGIFVGKANYMPIFGVIAGFLVIMVTLLITLPPTDPPVKEALLQTA